MSDKLGMLIVRVEKSLLKKFKDKIKEDNKKLETNKLNQSIVIRSMISDYINK